MDASSPKDESQAAKARAELAKLEEKLRAVDDPVIRTVLVERIEALRAALPAAESAEEPAPQEPEPQIEIVPPTPAQMEAAESLIRQAHVEKVRGNLSGAAELMRKAAEAAPTAPSVLEAAGDDAMSRKRYREAREAYAKALVVAPGNVSLERKHAEAVLYAQAPPMGWSQAASEETVASRKSALLLNAIVPGLGHMVLGRLATGIVLAVLFVVGIVWATLALRSKADTAAYVPPAAIIAVVYVYGLATVPGGGGRGRNRADRPKPPVDLPFE